MNQSQYSPNEVTNPAAFIQEILMERNWSLEDFAQRAGLDSSVAAALVDGSTPVTAYVTKISECFGSSEEFWTTLQRRYDSYLQTARAVRKTQIHHISGIQPPVNSRLTEEMVAAVMEKLRQRNLKIVSGEFVDAVRFALSTYQTTVVPIAMADALDRVAKLLEVLDGQPR